MESAGATSEHLRDESAVVPDPTDRATIEEEHALELRTRDRERKLLKKRYVRNTGRLIHSNLFSLYRGLAFEN